METSQKVVALHDVFETPWGSQMGGGHSQERERLLRLQPSRRAGDSRDPGWTVELAKEGFAAGEGGLTPAGLHVLERAEAQASPTCSPPGAPSQASGAHLAPPVQSAGLGLPGARLCAPPMTHGHRRIMELCTGQHWLPKCHIPSQYRVGCPAGRVAWQPRTSYCGHTEAWCPSRSVNCVLMVVIKHTGQPVECGQVLWAQQAELGSGLGSERCQDAGQCAGTLQVTAGIRKR